MAAIRTAPAAMSFASLAIGSNDVVATSMAPSIAVLIISAISTNAIASRSAISSSFVTSAKIAATRTTTAIPKWIRMFRCVRSTWMIPSKAKLKESRRLPDRWLIPTLVWCLTPLLPLKSKAKAVSDTRNVSDTIASCQFRLPPLHLLTVVVAEQVEQAVRQRPAPLLAHDGGAQHDVAERPRDPIGKLVTTVDREREH